MAISTTTKGSISHETDLKKLCQILIASLAADPTVSTTFVTKDVGAGDSVETAFKKAVAALEGGTLTLSDATVLVTAANDTTAASAGVPVGGFYKTAAGDIKYRTV